MKTICFKIAAYIICVFLFSCATDQTSLLVQQQKTDTENHMTDIKNSLFKKGSILAGTECTECHRYYSPEEYTSEEWDRIIRSKSRRLSLGKEQLNALDFYFKTKSRKSE